MNSDLSPTCTINLSVQRIKQEDAIDASRHVADKDLLQKPRSGRTTNTIRIRGTRRNGVIDLAPKLAAAIKAMTPQGLHSFPYARFQTIQPDRASYRHVSESESEVEFEFVDEAHCNVAWR